MANRDAAFIWETEALRTSVASPIREPGRHMAPGSGRLMRSGWVTLREASDATGIPVATLRSWVRKKRVPSAIDETPVGTRRMVRLDRVLSRAEQLGREVDVDLRVEEPVMVKAPDTPSSEVAGPPPGTMLVPIEAWDKMLIQLGNLHEAGQQLAEARERAARAETEATFLRERLAELRANLAVSAPDGEPEPVGGGPATPPSFTAYLWRSATSRFRPR